MNIPIRSNSGIEIHASVTYIVLERPLSEWGKNDTLMCGKLEKIWSYSRQDNWTNTGLSVDESIIFFLDQTTDTILSILMAYSYTRYYKTVDTTSRQAHSNIEI